MILVFACFFFFNDTATTEIYTLSLHDALPISSGEDGIATSRLGMRPARYAVRPASTAHRMARAIATGSRAAASAVLDRKSTRLNSSHGYISYAVFCLKKKNTHSQTAVHFRVRD